MRYVGQNLNHVCACTVLSVCSSILYLQVGLSEYVNILLNLMCLVGCLVPARARRRFAGCKKT